MSSQHTTARGAIIWDKGKSCPIHVRPMCLNHGCWSVKSIREQRLWSWFGLYSLYIPEVLFHCSTMFQDDQEGHMFIIINHSGMIGIAYSNIITQFYDLFNLYNVGTNIQPEDHNPSAVAVGSGGRVADTKEKSQTSQDSKKFPIMKQGSWVITHLGAGSNNTTI